MIYKNIKNIVHIISLNKIKKNILNLIKFRNNKRLNINFISFIFYYKLFNKNLSIKLIFNSFNKLLNINFIFYWKFSSKINKYLNIFINKPFNYYYKELNDKFDWKVQFKARIKNDKSFFHLLYDVKKIVFYPKSLIQEKVDNLIFSCIKFDSQFDYYDLCKNINYNNLYDFNELSKLFWKRILLTGLNDNILHKSITTMMNFVIKKIQFHHRVFFNK